MLSCRRASYLISESLDRPLRFRERFFLRLHLAICKICRGFRTNMLSLQKKGREWHNLLDQIYSAEELSPESRKKITDQIHRELE